MERKDQGEKMLQWHPAFFADIQIEFEQEKQRLIFENEHHLGTKRVYQVSFETDAVFEKQRRF